MLRDSIAEVCPKDGTDMGRSRPSKHSRTFDEAFCGYERLEGTLPHRSTGDWWLHSSMGTREVPYQVR